MKRGKGEVGRTRRYYALVKNIQDTRLGPNRVTSKAQQDRREAKEMPPAPRMSPDMIAKLYDEYGFPKPDASFVQKNLPNNEKELRKILSMHRDIWNKETKQRMETMLSGAKSYTGKGGLGDTEMTPEPQQSSQGMPIDEEMEDTYSPVDISAPTEAFFVGESGLIKLINPGQSIDNTPIWMVDVKNKILRPFKSKSAFNSYFEDPVAAKKAIVTFPTSALAPGGPLEGYRMLTMDYGIGEDGAMKKLDYSPAMISRRYGKPSDPSRENKAVLALDGFLKQLRAPSPSMEGTQPPIQQ